VECDVSGNFNPTTLYTVEGHPATSSTLEAKVIVGWLAGIRGANPSGQHSGSWSMGAVESHTIPCQRDSILALIGSLIAPQSGDSFAGGGIATANQGCDFFGVPTGRGHNRLSIEGWFESLSHQ
jgi:hypothetical protein